MASEREQTEIVWVNVEKLTPAEYNPRRMRPSAFAKLKDSINRFGMVDPLIANENNGMVVGGHQRLRAAIDLGWTEVPVVYTPLTDDEEKALNIALNNAEISGDWETGKLGELLTSLKDTDLLTATGFDEHQVAQMLDRMKKKAAAPVYKLAQKLLEHYDYVVIFAEHETDWMNLRSIFGLETEQSYKKQKIGTGRVVPFSKLIEVLERHGVMPELVAEPEEASKDE